MSIGSLVVDNLAKVVATIAGTGLISLFAWLHKRGSWTKEHKLARLCEEQGDRLCDSSLLPAAIEKYKAAIDIWEKDVNQTKLLGLYQKIGKAHMKNGDTDSALQALNHCEALWDAIKKASKMHEVYYALAEVYLGKHDYEKAAQYIDKTTAILRQQQSPRLPVALALAARIARERDRSEEAEAYYIEATKVLESIGDTLGLASVYYELGELKSAHHAPRMAVVYYKRASANYARLGSTRAVELEERIVKLETLDQSSS